MLDHFLLPGEFTPYLLQQDLLKVRCIHSVGLQGIYWDSRYQYTTFYQFNSDSRPIPHPYMCCLWNLSFMCMLSFYILRQSANWASWNGFSIHLLTIGYTTARMTNTSTKILAEFSSSGTGCSTPSRKKKSSPATGSLNRYVL